MASPTEPGAAIGSEIGRPPVRAPGPEERSADPAPAEGRGPAVREAPPALADPEGAAPGAGEDAAEHGRRIEMEGAES